MSGGAAGEDALLAARLCAHDPRLGGIVLRGGGGAVREAVSAALAAALPVGAPVRRVPGHADDAQLIGGLDLGAALAGQGARLRHGLIAAADGGLLVVPMAERLSASSAARLSAALDTGMVAIERDGLAGSVPARIAIAAYDDAAEGESLPPALAERLAFWIALDAAPTAAADEQPGRPVDDRALYEALAATAAALGIGSARAGLFALRAARASAALAGRDGVTEADVRCAARLVLGPRATRLPAPEAAPAAPEESQSGSGDNEGAGEGAALEDRVLAAAQATVPADLLAALASGIPRRGPGLRARGAGERRRSIARGRPAGVRAGEPRGGARLALVATLRAATPWQRLRGRTGRVLIRRGDLRVQRFEARAGLVTIMAVDASGSAAVARLAEAKGAVELLLAQAYVQRAEVALVAFRGVAADVLLPPTRSLARARRALAELPGGGGTPLASGIEAARALAVAARARGRTPFVVILSDGRGNIAADGTPGRPAAERDAIAAARALAADGIVAAFIDTSPRARPEAGRLAAAMHARYVALPVAGAESIEAAVSALAPPRGRG